MTTQKKFRSRQREIVVQALKGGEVLIYDLKIDKALSLNKTAALIWQLCGEGDKAHSPAELSRELSRRLKTPVSEDLVWLALGELAAADLLMTADGEESQTTVSGAKKAKFALPGGVSRRELIHKVGLASMVALPLIVSLTAPKAAHAASIRALGADCTTGVCAAGLVCTNQFNTGTLCRAVPGAACTFARPDLCTSGCCTAQGAPPGGAICCN